MPSLFLTSAAKGKRTVLWTLAGFAVSQVVLSIYLDGRSLEMRDPLYGHRLRALQARLAQSPQSPLFLVMGSSRVKYSLSPNAMKLPATGGASSPIVYNFGINGMGTIRELMYLRRLLSEGIRPTWLLLEVWPPLWPETGFFRESRMVENEDDQHWRDLPLLCRYFRNERDLLRLAFRKSVMPIRAYRSSLLGGFVQWLLPREQVEEMDKRVSQCLPESSDGWFPWPWTAVTAEDQRRGINDGIEKIKPLIQSLHVDPRSDTALRELLAECQRNGIHVALILLPDHSITRSWYTDQGRALVRDYLDRIHRECQVPIVDARDWVPDEHFADACHIGPRGVAPFSERVGREVVEPLLEGNQPDSRILFPGEN